MRKTVLLLIAGCLAACSSGQGPACEGPECVDPTPVPGSSLLLHSSFDDAETILTPEVAARPYDTMEEAAPGLLAGDDYVTFEPGVRGQAVRFNGQDYPFHELLDGLINFHGDNFDFDDPDDDGGRLDFWIKFNVYPVTANTWLARSNWSRRDVNFEYAASNATSPHFFNVYVFSEASTEVLRVNPGGWSPYEAIREGEWHLFTFLWKRGTGDHDAEFHMYVDGTKEGCYACSAYERDLPAVDSIANLAFSPPLNGNYIQFSLDDLYSFRSWDTSGVTGNFAEIDPAELP